MDKFHEDGTPRPEKCLCIKCLNKFRRDNAPISKEEFGYKMELDPISPAFNIESWFE